ncbi:MAG: V-type ATP synthase subunit F [Peptoniphilaceae bacterium]|nr:V-type ATP synthase subunit F [Peptoniphilaceae bacterium]MDY3738649.1 V-type ATP synthase subunit F [Peptoniphilaceae bacterium]
MYKVAVIGDKDSILCFKALGVDVYTAVDGKEVKQIVKNLDDGKTGVIFLTEELASEIPEVIEKYKKKMVPAIILIPSNKGSLNIGMNEIDKNVEKAIGANIFK